MGFALPFETWMRGKMRSEMESVLLTPSQKLSNFIADDGVQKIWIDFLEKRCSWSRPWSLYIFKVIHANSDYNFYYKKTFLRTHAS